MIILVNLDNFIGIVYSEEYWKELVDVFRKYNVIVLLDEIYGILYFLGIYCSLVKFYFENIIFSLGLFKWVSVGGWRLGYYIYLLELRFLLDVVKSVVSYIYLCVFVFMQYVVLIYLSLFKELKVYMFYLRRILVVVVDYSYQYFIEVGVKVVKLQGGFYMFLDFEVIRCVLVSRGIIIFQQMCDVIFEEIFVVVMFGGFVFFRLV